MHIDLTKYKMFHYFEDTNGKIYDGMSSDLPQDIDRFTYHCLDTQTVSHSVDEYTWHPEYKYENNHFYQAMLQFPWFYKLMYNKMKRRSESKTFKHMFDGQFHYGDGRVIVAMVNSGDYNLGEALYVYSNACERCANVLWHKYVGGDEGYEEFSEEWKKCNTECDFCREYNQPSIY